MKFEKPKVKQRTDLQNRSLHLYFTLLSEALNDAGFDMKKTIREDIDIPWTPETVKNNIWRAVQTAYVEKESTTQLTTDEVTKIYDIVNRAIGQRTGVYVEFPNIDSCLDQVNK